jgi:hypothetical protein
MDFIFARPDKFDRETLQQGDLLRRTSALNAALDKAHPNYARDSSYKYFMVLTQSCDLVRRKATPKSEFLTIAAVRPFSILLEGMYRKYKLDTTFPIRLCEKKKEIIAQQLLERFLHNTVDDYFFLRKESHPMVAEDLCVFLRLSITLESNNYDTCVEAKVAQLSDVFQAKLGWLTGNIYSRVGTPDIDDELDNVEDYKKDFFRATMYGDTAWVSASQYTALEQLVREWKRDNGRDPDTKEAEELLKELPDDLELLVTKAIERLRAASILPSDPEILARAKNALLNDGALQKVFRGLAG